MHNGTEPVDADRSAGARLRLLAAVGVALALAVAAAVAWATPTKIPVNDEFQLNLNAGDDAIFDVSQPPYSYNNACAVGDLAEDIGYTPANEVSSTDGSRDLFDGGLVLAVRSPAGTTVFEDSNGFGNVVGEQIIVGPERIQGLRVSRVERALKSGPTLRSLIKLRNPKRNKAVKRTLIWDSDLGADHSEVARASSSGDRALTNDDRWVVFADDLETPSDAVGTFVLFGKGKGVKRTKVLNPIELEGADSCVSFKVNVKVPRRSTRYLLFFTQVHDKDAVGQAIGDARRFNRRSPRGVLSGLKKSVKRNVVNWDL